MRELVHLQGDFVDSRKRRSTRRAGDSPESRGGRSIRRTVDPEKIVDSHSPVGARWPVAALPLLVLLLAAAAPPCDAHPHVFVSNRMTVLFDQGALQGITFQWTFDDMFSAMILADYDPAHTHQFDAARTKELKAGAFDNLENYHYFVAISIGKTPVRRLSIERFAPSVTDKGRLVYSFFIPVKLTVTPEEQTVALTVYDDSYYVAFDILHVQDVEVQAGPEVACALAVQKTKVKPAWPGQYMPDQLVIRFKETS